MTQERERLDRPQIAGLRVGLALIVPPTVALLVGLLVGSLTDVAAISSEGATAVLTAGSGIAALLLGLRWYGAAGLGFRGGRPLFASIGFAVMAWVAFLILRFIFVEILGFGPPNSLRSYVYLLLFEAFAVQVWTFGTLFRAVADWRGALTAAFAGGIVFGLVATLLFQESFTGGAFAVLYFVAWGVLYGMIRLRTGSFLGAALVQSLHSFTAWVVMTPYPQPDPNHLQTLYVAAVVVYALFIWRLWPKQPADYRL